MSRAGHARREHPSRSLASRVRRAAAGVASFVPGFLLRLPRAASLLALLAAFAFSAPAAAQTDVELVGNDGQTFADATSGTYEKDYATSFTTGGNRDGYVLTRVDVFSKLLEEGLVGDKTDIRIYADASGVPGTWLGLGTKSHGATTDAFARVQISTYDDPLRTAPTGINLDASTKYWVVVVPSLSVTAKASKVLLAGTSSDDEESTGLSGWSLGNHRLWKNKGAGTSWDTTNTDANALVLELQGRTTSAPSAPTGLTVSAGTNSGELDASWTAPSGTVTDYDLRYYEGASDPTDAADWVEEHETDGLGTADSTATSATIKGLKASTAYRVQVRAADGGAEGAWSASVAGTTDSPSGTNNAPKAMTQKSGDADNSCKLWTDTSQPADTTTASAGNLTSVVLKTRGTETDVWPTSCTVSGNRFVPVFDDRDGGDLYYTFSYTLPANVRGFGGDAPFFWDASNRDRLWARAVAIGSATGVRIDLTARDDHGASATAWVRVTVGVMVNTVGAPAFSAQVADQTAGTGTAFFLALPVATGGDVSKSGTAINSPYTYAVSGLPAGLSFDAATRTVSGTPRAGGSFTVTYTADDADADYSLRASPDAADTADAASQTFTIQVGEPPSVPTGLTVSAGTNSGELDASWTAPSGTVTDYDLRYYEGAADPTDAADWVEEHETNGLGTGDSTSTSVTIKGLKSSTAYRVQVRAANADGEGAWSASVAATTSAASGTNNAPKAMTQKPLGHGTANSCELWTDTSQPAETIAASAGSLTQLDLTTRGTEADVWPTTCTKSGARKAPVFDDRDGVGDLYFTMRYTADNVRGLGGSAPFSLSKSDEGRHRLNAAAVAIGTATGVRIDLTARDEHGASASAWVRFDVGVMANSAGAPAFSAQVADQTADTGTALSLVLPAATGGDVSTSFGRAINSPYTYAVSGLPAGLSFDAATRRVSGTPSAAGTFTVTYTADDADADYSLRASPDAADTADVASQTFTIQVTGPPPPPPTVPLLLSARVSSDGMKLTLYYDQELDPNSAPAHARFSTNIGGEGQALPRDGAATQREAPVTVAGSTVTMDLVVNSNNAVTSSQAVAMGYNAAAAANPLKNLAGLKAPRVSGLAAINDRGETVPTVTGVSITSLRTHDTDGDSAADTYGVGAKIWVRVAFSEEVIVDTSRGKPRLKIGFGGGNHKWAVYESGSGTQTLRFDYTVVSGDTSTAGVAVVANTLELTGGSIRSNSGLYASLAHVGGGPWSDQKVDATLDGQPPRFESATVNGDRVTVTFDEALDTAALTTPSDFTITVTAPDGSKRHVDGKQTGDVTIPSGTPERVEFNLQAAVRPGATLAVGYKQSLIPPVLQDTNGQAVKSFSGEPVTNNTAALSDPTNLAVAAGTQSGSLTVTWDAPTTGTLPTGYGLRYYAGSEDPPAGREADWKEDAVGLPTDTAGTAETATIEGLKANTAYRVQLRAKYSGFNGPWSASKSGTTGTPPATNNAPRVLRQKQPRPATGNLCEVVTNDNEIKRELRFPATGALVSRGDMVPHGPRTADDMWPSECTGSHPTYGRLAPDFDDVDGDDLILTAEPAPLPANVRVRPEYYFKVDQNIKTDNSKNGRVYMEAQSAFRPVPDRAVRAKVTATDPHGASASIRVYFIVATVANSNGAPTLPEVAHVNASTGRAFSMVLPAATGGDNFQVGLTRGGAPQHYYAVSGLPEGLTFDPATRRISGTPSESGSFEVTYIADDPDTVGSAYLNPTTTNTNDVASRTFTINVKPFIDMVRVTSAPTHDANGDGRNDTYTKGDKLVFDVEFTEPVKVDGEGADGTNVRLRLDVGPNGGGKDQRDANREVAKLTDTFHGGKTLRFTYIVETDRHDADGVFVQTFGDDGEVLKLRNGATIKGLVSKLDADLTNTDFITGGAVGEDGIPMTYVNGRTSAAGPTPTSATVNGTTLSVTFDENLSPLSDADREALQLHFGVQGTDGTGGNRNAFQHPSKVWVSPGNVTVLLMTLGVAARAGETITLTYKRFDHKGPLKDYDGNMAPAFVDFVVKNDTAGGTTGTGAKVALVGNTGQSNNGTFAFERETAQAFTTGSNTQGYKVTSVTVPYSGGVPAAASHGVFISREAW